jgi:hypothetical protein
VLAKRIGVVLLLALAALALYMAEEADPAPAAAQAQYPVGNVPTISEIFSKFR